MTAAHPIPGQPEQVVLTIGDIGVSPNWVVTPNGTAPLRDSQWTVQDRTFMQQATPTWAIVMAILGIVFCFLGLLFLIVKENQTSGFTEVTVRSHNVFHIVQLPANSPHAVAQARQWVYQAQSMAAAVR